MSQETKHAERKPMNTETKTEWRMVPVDATEEVIDALMENGAEGTREQLASDYKVGVLAAPTPPASEPVHFRAVLAPNHIAVAADRIPKVIGFEKKSSAENWIEEQRTFKGWNYSLQALYLRPAPCERCAELDLLLRNLLCVIHRDGGQHIRAHGIEQSIEDAKEKFFDLRDLPEKLAALEAEKEEIKQAIRWAPSSAHWSNVLIKLCGEDSRDGINALEKQLREAQATIAQRAEQLAAQKDAERYRWIFDNCEIRDEQGAIEDETQLDAAIAAAQITPDTKG